MGTESLQARISLNNQKIRELESQISELKRLLNRLLAKQNEFDNYVSNFSDLMRREVANVQKIRMFENTRVAEGLADSLHISFTGSQANNAFESFKRIENSLQQKIEETEHDLKKAKREINQLESDISYCRREIAII